MIMLQIVFINFIIECYSFKNMHRVRGILLRNTHSLGSRALQSELLFYNHILLCFSYCLSYPEFTFSSVLKISLIKISVWCFWQCRYTFFNQAFLKFCEHIYNNLLWNLLCPAPSHSHKMVLLPTFFFTYMGHTFLFLWYVL